MWALADWQGTLYRADSGPATFLGQYASVFNAVEGNTTFYAVPSPAVVANWLEKTPETFRFCFKFPRSISHDRGIRDVAAEVRAFLLRMRPLGHRLGPFMLQLPASAGPAVLAPLATLLDELPGDVRVAVEFRHRAFFESDDVRERAAALLDAAGAQRVILDSRPLRSGDAGHPEVLAAEHEKPDLPVLADCAGHTPLVRFIAHPQSDVTAPWIMHWARRLAAWIGEGRQPYVFMHCPNNARSPGFARDLHAALREALAGMGLAADTVGHMPAWPGEQARRGGGEQLTLM